MRKAPLFVEIAEAIRQEIVYGTLKPDDELPTIREMATKWHCSPGTVLRAYQQLSEQGLVVSRPGAGTHVASDTSSTLQTPLRRATLINKTEAFLLQAITSGYSVTEIENSFLLALDRYKTLPPEKSISSEKSLRFVGSHDPAVTLVSSRLAEKYKDFAVKISFVGSLGGLLALARGDADFAGSHLWDQETGIYNRPFIHRIFPGKRIALLRLADRHIGLIFKPGNPQKIMGLKDLTKTDVRFINRQQGAGTRVWLEAQLQILKLKSEKINGFTNEANSHAEVAGAILENQADTGLGIETAALGYGLEFLPLTTENYDLVIPEDKWDLSSIRNLREGLKDPHILEAINLLGGYDTTHTGMVEWID